jgi:hypothetical protein
LLHLLDLFLFSKLDSVLAGCTQESCQSCILDLQDLRASNAVDLAGLNGFDNYKSTACNGCFMVACLSSNIPVIAAFVLLEIERAHF